MDGVESFLVSSDDDDDADDSVDGDCVGIVGCMVVDTTEGSVSFLEQYNMIPPVYGRLVGKGGKKEKFG